MAAYIKKEFDKKYNPAWHCIVGRNFGNSCFPSPADCAGTVQKCYQSPPMVQLSCDTLMFAALSFLVYWPHFALGLKGMPKYCFISGCGSTFDLVRDRESWGKRVTIQGEHLSIETFCS